MKLKVNELKEFRDKAAPIQSNNLLPILSYLKFEPGKVTKNNMQSFFTMEIDCTETFLVDEKQLMSFLSFTKAAEIDLVIEPAMIHINDGSKIKYSSPTEPAQYFPLNDYPTDAEVKVPPTYLKHILTAANFNIENGGNPVASHVFVANGLIAGADGQIAYMEKSNAEFTLVLARGTALAIGKLDGDVMFSENDSYHFFRTGRCKYAFIKPTQAVIDFNPFLAPLDGLPSFVVEKDYLIAINDLASSRNPLPLTLGRLQLQGNTLTVDYKNDAYNLDMADEIPCTGDNMAWFGFNANLFNRALKAVPGDKVRLTEAGNKLYFTPVSDANTYTALMGRINVQPE